MKDNELLTFESVKKSRKVFLCSYSPEKKGFYQVTQLQRALPPLNCSYYLRCLLAFFSDFPSGLFWTHMVQCLVVVWLDLCQGVEPRPDVYVPDTNDIK
jgi:hypothetical protein